MRQILLLKQGKNTTAGPPDKRELIMTADSPHAVLRLRTLVPSGISPVQSEVINQLQKLEAKGIVAELDIDVWGLSMGINVPRDNNPTGTQQLLSEFERWADEHDCTLRPAFSRSNAKSTADDATEHDEYTILPLLCLAIYDGTTVQSIYPHVTHDGARPIHDGLATLESMKQDRDQMEVESNETSTVTSR